MKKEQWSFHKIVTIEHAIYGLRFQIKFKIVKVAHTPIYINSSMSTGSLGGGACSTQLPYRTILALVGINFI